MDVRPIETQADYDWALAEIEQYFDAEPAHGSLEAARFSVLATLIGAYEDKHYPIEDLDPIDAIREVMREKGYRQTDLAKLIGSRSRASEILSRKRPLTMEQAWKLHQAWRIPAEVLLRPSASPASAAADPGAAA
jgi:HTH-type transcriptional regulator/antitoxin HigA